MAPTPAGPRPAVEVRGLKKSLGNQVVLDGIDFAVAEGTVFALLGPNGSGKTTTVQILATLLAADEGTVQVAGHDVIRQPDLVRRSIGVTGQFSALDNLLTGRENLQLMSDLTHLDRAIGSRRASELLERLDLVDAADQTASTYSGGMRRRLDLAMTLIAEPRIIFLDEPSAGLDPRSRHTLWAIVRELTSAGVTILLTTQYLEEADQLAGHIAVLDGGHLVAEGAPAELKRRVPGGHVVLHFADQAMLASAARVAEGEADRTGLSLRIPSDGTLAHVRALLGTLEDRDVEVETVSVHTADLDDVFFALTGGTDTTHADPRSTNERS